MENHALTLTLGWLGLLFPLVLGAIGSAVGCARAGMAACGAMLDTDGNYGRFVGVSAMPSSQIIYGIVISMSLRRAVTPENAPALFAVGMLVGLALCVSAIMQGNCCAAAIHTAKAKPETFGISVAPAALVEGFSVFAFVFGLVLAADIPS